MGRPPICAAASGGCGQSRLSRTRAFSFPQYPGGIAALTRWGQSPRITPQTRQNSFLKKIVTKAQISACAHPRHSLDTPHASARPVRLSVRTPGFQPGKRGSIPLRAASRSEIFEKKPLPESRHSGPFVYRLGRQVFNLERGVRFPYGLPLPNHRNPIPQAALPVRLSAHPMHA